LILQPIDLLTPTLSSFWGGEGENGGSIEIRANATASVLESRALRRTIQVMANLLEPEKHRKRHLDPLFIGNATNP
jgi:hypothetical protein